MEELSFSVSLRLSLMSGTSVTAHNYRSQQFVDVLVNHQIPLIVVAVNRSTGVPLSQKKVTGMIEYWEVNDLKRGWRALLRKSLFVEKINAAIGCMLQGALLAHSMLRHLPLWVDFYGDPLIEKIGQDLHHGNQHGTLAMRWRLRQVLTYTDRFSVCSESQKSLLIGALLYSGRIDFKNMKRSLVNVFMYLNESGSSQKRTPDRPERTSTTPVAILYNGSVNSWTDVTFLSEVLEEVLEARPHVQFVQFGKNIVHKEHLESFRKFSEKKGIKERAQFLGEITEEKAQELYRNSHICISADIDTLETRFGWRTRYVRAIAEGLVVVSTLGNDLAAMLADDGVGLFSEIGNKTSFVKNLLLLIDDASLWKQLSDKGVKYIAEKSQDDSQFDPLLKWLESPQKLESSKDIPARIRNVGTYLRWPLAGRLRK